jgi:plasmid stabilization system protein ParE
MEYRVDISIPALEDAEAAFLWIRQFNKDTAKAWYEGLLEAVFSLEQLPYRCSLAPESEILGREVRQLIYGKRNQTYKIFFEICEEEKAVRIYRVWHSSKDWISAEEFNEGKPEA